MRIHFGLAVATSLAFQFAVAQQADIDLIKQRRKADLSQFPTPDNYASVPAWLRSQTTEGTWPDVDYTAGCEAREQAGRTSTCRALTHREGELADTAALDPDHHPRLGLYRS